MQNKIFLINAMRSLVKKLEGGVQYDWLDPRQCNCGLLLRELEPEFHAVPGVGSYRNVTRLTAKEFFGRFEKYGLKLCNLYSLENLSNKIIKKRSGLDKVRYCSLKSVFYRERANLILYLHAWADILEEQDAERFERRPLNLTPRSKTAPESNAEHKLSCNQQPK